ncbi:MAG: ATP-binding cassette domain-containing protein [Caulobacterales bacterium]
MAGVSAGYGQGYVLHGLDFEARAGEVALVTGGTGAGKTSFAHLLRLALTPRGGRALILGADPANLNGATRARLKKRIGYVAEDPVFVEHWTAFDNIALPLKLAGRKVEDYAEDVRALVQYAGLNSAAGEPAWRLSAVERRRTAIARALASKPDLLIADAPTSGLAADQAARVVRLLAELRRVGAAVVITSQDDSIGASVRAAHWRLELGRLRREDDDESAEAAE